MPTAPATSASRSRNILISLFLGKTWERLASDESWHAVNTRIRVRHGAVAPGRRRDDGHVCLASGRSGESTLLPCWHGRLMDARRSCETLDASRSANGRPQATQFLCGVLADAWATFTLCHALHRHCSPVAGKLREARVARLPYFFLLRDVKTRLYAMRLFDSVESGRRMYM